MSSRARLLPTADVAGLADRCYLLDRAALYEEVTSVPTQLISRRTYDVIRRIKTIGLTHEPRDYAALEPLFDDPEGRAAICITRCGVRPARHRRRAVLCALGSHQTLKTGAPGIAMPSPAATRALPCVLNVSIRAPFPRR